MLTASPATTPGLFTGVKGMSYQVTGQSNATMKMNVSRLFRYTSLLGGIIGVFWLGFNLKFFINNDRHGETLRFESGKREHPILSHKSAEANPRSEDSHSKNIGVLAQRSWAPFSAKHDYPYMLNSRLKCANRATKLYQKLSVIAIVASAPANFDRRNVMRMTWIRRAIEKKYSIKVMFMLGATSDRSVQSKIKQEAVLYDDIIQEAFLDSYLNLTVKTIGALKWVTQFCHGAKFFVKLDDDVAVNIGNLTGFLEYHVPSFNYIGGMVQVGAIALRNPEEKWYTPEELYPEATYPPYPEGKIYVMSMDVAVKIFDHSQTMEIFPWEDIFIGICAKHLKIIPQNFIMFQGVWRVKTVGIGLIKTEETLTYLSYLYAVYDLDVGQMIEVWQAWMKNSWD